MRLAWRRTGVLIPALAVLLSCLYFLVLLRLHHEQLQGQGDLLSPKASLSLQQPKDLTTIFVTNTGGGTITRRVIHSGNHSTASRRPPLDKLIDKFGNIQGDVQFLLDFAIVGFGKSGTSTLMHMLSQHSQVACFRQEIWELIHSQPGTLVHLLYKQLPASPFLKHGYKCPAEITEPHILEYYRTYWPKTRLIVGIRHPVPWFQSLYNFRLQNIENGPPLPPPTDLIGRCFKGMQLTCTEKANFAYHLLRLGKHNDPSLHQSSSPQTTRLVQDIVGHFPKTWYNVSEVPFHPNPIFLYETSQLEDPLYEREFRHDLQHFLGLSSEIQGPIPVYKPGMVWANASLQAHKDSLKIDICRDEYLSVRAELMRLAIQTSEWIRIEFLNYPSVTVSSRSRFESILEGWKRDPCVDRASNV